MVGQPPIWRGRALPPEVARGTRTPPPALGQPMKNVKECDNPSQCLTECTLINWGLSRSAARGTAMVTCKDYPTLVRRK